MHEQTHHIVEALHNNQRTIEIKTLAGPETLSVSWKKSLAVGNSEYYQVIAKNSRNKDIGNVDYAIDLSTQPPTARVVHKFVEPPYRGKDIAQQLFQLVAKDLEERGILEVRSQIRKDNVAAFVSQHVREMLTGRRYKTTHQETAGQPEFYDVINFLDQFEDEQGET